MNRKRLAAGTAAAFLLIGGGTAAYAYWTANGTGSGSAVNQAGADTLNLSASFAAATLAPGVSVPVSFSASNPGTAQYYVTTLNVDSITTDVAGCLPAWFSLGSTSIAQGTQVAAGATVALPNGTTLSFNNLAVNQDACKSAVVTLTLSSV